MGRFFVLNDELSNYEQNFFTIIGLYLMQLLININ